MVMFRSESEFLELLDQCDALVLDAVGGTLDVRALYTRLGDVHGHFALDGHESDEEELALMHRHQLRLSFIEDALDALNGLCAESDATKQSYIDAGRYGADEALRRLRLVVASRTPQT